MLLDTAYDLWDLEMPYIPERSLLYCLKPQGIGTAQVRVSAVISPVWRRPTIFLSEISWVESP